MTDSNAATKEVEGELAVMPPAQVPATGEEQGSVALMRLIERAATSADFDVAKLEKLLDVKERWEANEARKAFVVAKAAFSAAAPKLTKNKHVGFDSKKAGASRTDYHHTTLDHAAEILSPVLSKHGLTYSWETEQLEGGMIRVTCVLTHVLGHSERVSLQAGPDQSGNKNNIQAVGSTVTYLQRYTLLAATGMATADQDLDGIDPVEFISAEQKETLIGLMKEVEADIPKFLRYLGIAAIDELPSNRFGDAITALGAKRKAKE